jgi:hypothetical protein
MRASGSLGAAIVLGSASLLCLPASCDPASDGETVGVGGAHLDAGTDAADDAADDAGGGANADAASDAEAPPSPLFVHPENPRYFTDGSGKAVYLTGAHTWSNLLDRGVEPPDLFDYAGYLDFLEDHHHNFMRMWAWELPRYSCGGEVDIVVPLPWARTGPETATDGEPQFDLTQLNQAYFDRIRERVEAARERGIYVSIMLFEGYGLQFCRLADDGFPFAGANNVNGIDAPYATAHTLDNADVTAVQEAFVSKVVDTVNDLPNVLYEIANEDGGGSLEWHLHMVDFVKSYEATKPFAHPVGMTFRHQGGTNAELFDSAADWISPNPEGGYRDNPPAADGSQVVLSDTDHLWGIGGSPSWVWKSFLRGLNPIYMDPYDDTADESVRVSLGHTLRYAEKMDLAAMTPQSELASSGYCLADPTREYLVYLPDGGTVTVDLSSASGSFAQEWFDVTTGDVASSEDLEAGVSVDLVSPFAGEAVAYLVAR